MRRKNQRYSHTKTLMKIFDAAHTGGLEEWLGGPSSFAQEVIAEHGLDIRLARSAVNEMPRALSGSQQYLLEHYGLTPRAVAESASASLALEGS
jgi:transketolase C-terminal domain/subunit